GIGAWSRQALDPAAADRIDGRHEHDRHGAAYLLKRAHDRPSRSQDDIRRERDQLRSVSAKAVETPGAPPDFAPYVAAPGRAQPGEPLRERRDAFQSSLIALDRAHQHADAPHARARAASGQAAAPPSSVMNVRRLMGTCPPAGLSDRLSV